MRHDTIDLIRAKRDGTELEGDAIRWLVDAYTRREIPDEQMSAFLMSVFFRGMTPDELVAWTWANIDSGVRKDLSGLGAPTADKHSTGGVGDKITLPLAPLVASYGVAVPQLSGRGLGHTGGTLDKLESIPGWQADVDEEGYLRQLRDVGAVVCAAGNDLAPADKLLYALRDVTGTVESIPLIAGSIMSKKIAEGADTLVLDVKTGAGAFMRDPDQARELARTMVGLGTAAGVGTVALVTAMDRPLGRAAGNALEVAESVEVLQGGGPQDVVSSSPSPWRARCWPAPGGGTSTRRRTCATARPTTSGERMISAQHGDPAATLPRAAETHVVTAPGERHADPAGRVRRRCRRLAPRCRARPQGGPGLRSRRGHLDGRDRRAGARGPAAAHAAHRRPGPHRAGPRRPSTARSASTPTTWRCRWCSSGSPPRTDSPERSAPRTRRSRAARSGLSVPGRATRPAPRGGPASSASGAQRLLIGPVWISKRRRLA